MIRMRFKRMLRLSAFKILKLAAGKVVTISESSINFKGWGGSGYTMLDKTTDAGAYMISG